MRPSEDIAKSGSTSSRTTSCIELSEDAATESTSRLERHRVHDACHTRIQLRPWCPADRRELEPREIVPAVEVARDRYVVLTNEDMEALPVATKRRLKIEQFLPAEEARAATRFVKATLSADGAITGYRDGELILRS